MLQISFRKKIQKQKKFDLKIQNEKFCNFFTFCLFSIKTLRKYLSVLKHLPRTPVTFSSFTRQKMKNFRSSLRDQINQSVRKKEKSVVGPTLECFRK